MERKMEIAIVHGVFEGIYSWGKGYESMEVHDAWEKAIREVKSVFWKVVDSGERMVPPSLVSIQGSIYLHPMDFTTVLHRVGCSEDCYDCDDLNRVCTEIAEKCGGTFKLYVSKPLDVNAELVPYTLGIHDKINA